MSEKRPNTRNVGVGNGRKMDKPWQHALRLAVMSRDKKGERRLRLLADRCVKSALEGDMSAIKEIGDRLDGKPTQHHGQDEAAPFKMIVEWAKSDES